MLPVKPLFKILLAVLAGLLVLVVAVAVMVFVLVKPDDYRDLVVENVQRQTGRELSIEGKLGLDLFPCCALEVERATLGNPAGFEGEPFIRLASARLALRLWPLLTKRELQVGTVSIDGLEARLQVAADGRDNWTFDTPAAQPPGDAAAGEPGLADFSVAGLRISDGWISYADERSGSRYSVENLELTTGQLRGREPFDLSTSLLFTDLEDNSSAAVSLRSRVVPGEVEGATVVRLENLDADLDGRGLAGLDGLKGKLTTPSLQFTLGEPTTLHAPTLQADLELSDPDLPGGAATIDASLTELRYDVDAAAGTVVSFSADAGVAGVPLQLTGGGQFGAQNALQGTVRVPAVSPRDVLARLKEDIPDTADPQVLRTLEARGDWFLRESAAGVDRLDLKLDDSRITGSLSRELLPAGSGRTPRTRFDLAIDQLDLDRYLAPDADSAPGTTGSAAPAEPLPTETLRGLNLEGRARIGRLTYDGLKLTDVAVTTEAAGGRLNLAPLTAKLYGGELQGRLRLDASGAEPRLTLNQTITGVALGPLLADFADVNNLAGTMTLNLEGTGTGKTSDALLENLAGSLAVSLTDGLYRGMDVWHEIRKGWAVVQRQPAPAREGPEQTAINALELTGKLSGGLLTTDRLLVEIPFLRISGGATVDVFAKTLDSKLTALVYEEPVFGDDTSLAGLVNARIPLTVSGPVESPKVRVDFSRMVRGAVKDELRDALQETLQKKGGRLLDRLGLGTPAAPAPGTAPPADDAGVDGEPVAPAAAPEEQPEDRLRRALDRLLKPDAPD